MEQLVDKVWAYFGVFGFIVVGLFIALGVLFRLFLKERDLREIEREKHRAERQKFTDDLNEERKDHNTITLKFTESLAVIRAYLERKG